MTDKIQGDELFEKMVASTKESVKGAFIENSEEDIENLLRTILYTAVVTIGNEGYVVVPMSTIEELTTALAKAQGGVIGPSAFIPTGTKD